MRVEIEITEQQEKFLREFASKQYPGAKDNLCTSMPIHVVQTRRDYFIEPDSDFADGDCFVGDEGETWETAEEVIRDYYESEECPVPIIAYKDAKGKDIAGVDGKVHHIYDEKDYFKAYKLGWEVNRCSRIKNYEDVAFFFILDEAKRYIEYQKHNLNQPRTFSYSPGYSNYGDYEHFWTLLMKIGMQLNEMS